MSEAARFVARAQPPQPPQQPPTPPHDDDSERGVLGGILLDNSIRSVVAEIVAPEEFYNPAHVQILAAIDAVLARGTEADVVTVSAELRARERLTTVGGGQYVGALSDVVSSIDSVAGYAREVHRLAERRSAIENSERAAHCARAGDTEGAAKFALRAAEAAERASRAGPRRPMTPAERALALGSEGVHLPTRIAAIDDATAGGPRVGDVVGVGGAPGAGKTTLCVNLAFNWAAMGYRVVILASDEAASGLLIRVGQAMGFGRETLESGDKDACAEFARKLDEEFPTLSLLDSHEGYSLEDAASLALRSSNGAPAVLVVDSLHTVPIAGSRQPETRREQINDVVNACKRRARDGLLVLATSEVRRGWYESKDPAKRVDPLAAFKESGGIEYAVPLAIMMQRVADENGLVDVVIPKNRIRPNYPEFRLKLDFGRAWFSAVPKPDAATVQAEEERAERAEDERIRRAILAAVRRNSKLTAKQALTKAAGVNHQRGSIIIDELLGEGVLSRREDKTYTIVPERSASFPRTTERPEAETVPERSGSFPERRCSSDRSTPFPLKGGTRERERVVEGSGEAASEAEEPERFDLPDGDGEVDRG